MSRTIRPVSRAREGRHGRETRRTAGRGGDVALDDTFDFLQLIWALDHGLQVSSKRMASLLGVTAPQRLVLRLVGKHPGISAGQLAGVLHVHKSTISGIIQRLEARRLLTREVDERDARRAPLSLTAAGRRLAGTLPNTVEAAVKRVLAASDAKSVRAARHVLEALARELTPRRR